MQHRTRCDRCKGPVTRDVLTTSEAALKRTFVSTVCHDKNTGLTRILCVLCADQLERFMEAK